MPVNSTLKKDAIDLLKSLISTPSFSKEENKTAELISNFFAQRNIPVNKKNNNIWITSKYRKEGLPTILLNSHHDTVKPVPAWQRNPFEPGIENDALFGLGSNDAGASLVALAVVFIHFYEEKELPFNLIYLASAEEEISGRQGVESVLEDIGKIDFGIIGEPTQMQMAIAEKGLLVIDGTAYGKAGHAAREEGENAIYTALKDIEFLQNFQFKKISEQLGSVKISVTQINAGTQHNVVPDQCRFVIDVRTTENYSNDEVFEILQKNTISKLKARSYRLNSSCISIKHPIVEIGQSLGLSTFGSATLSDQALMPFPTLKIGPGDSCRSHTADEFILLEEIKNGIDIYCQLLEGLIIRYKNIFNETLGKRN